MENAGVTSDWVRAAPGTIPEVGPHRERSIGTGFLHNHWNRSTFGQMFDRLRWFYPASEDPQKCLNWLWLWLGQT